MRTDIGRLHIEKVIVHDIPSGRVSGAAQPPVLSEIESPLRQQLRNYFREKIVRSPTSAAFDVEFDPTTTSPVPDLVLDNLGDQTKDFVARVISPTFMGCPAVISSISTVSPPSS